MGSLSDVGAGRDVPMRAAVLVKRPDHGSGCRKKKAPASGFLGALFFVVWVGQRGSLSIIPPSCVSSERRRDEWLPQLASV